MKIHRTTSLIAGSAVLLTAGASVGGTAQVTTAHAAGKTAPATKAPARPGGPGVMGTLTSASGNTLKVSLMATHKSATVTLTSKTTYLVNGKSTKARPSWKKGEQIQVMGTKGKNGAYTAVSIMVGGPPSNGQGPGPGGPPPGGAAPLSGSVISSTATSLVMKTSKGKATVKLTSHTRYTVNGKSLSSRPKLKAGQKVNVMAAKSGNTLTAQMVFIGAMPAPPSGGPPPAGSNTAG